MVVLDALVYELWDEDDLEATLDLTICSTMTLALAPCAWPYMVGTLNSPKCFSNSRCRSRRGRSVGPILPTPLSVLIHQGHTDLSMMAALTVKISRADEDRGFGPSMIASLSLDLSVILRSNTDLLGTYNQVLKLYQSEASEPYRKFYDSWFFSITAVGIDQPRASRDTTRIPGRDERLSRYAAAGNKAIVEYILDQGEPVDNRYGPLGLGARGCHVEVIELLLKKGANPNGPK